MQDKIAVILLFSITIFTLTSSTVSFSIIPHHRNSITTNTNTNIQIRNRNQQTHFTFLQATPTNDENSNQQQQGQDDVDTSLIIGKEIGQALQKIATEDGYLEAARKRNQEAKLKLIQQIQQEEIEAERIRKEMEERGNEGNYGPGDLSNFVGFRDDGFEASEGNDDLGGWSDLKKKGEEVNEEEKEEPKLFLFGNDNDDDGIITSSGGSGLIL